MVFYYFSLSQGTVKMRQIRDVFILCCSGCVQSVILWFFGVANMNSFSSLNNEYNISVLSSWVSLAVCFNQFLFSSNIAVKKWSVHQQTLLFCVLNNEFLLVLSAEYQLVYLDHILFSACALNNITMKYNIGIKWILVLRGWSRFDTPSPVWSLPFTVQITHHITADYLAKWYGELFEPNEE